MSLLITAVLMLCSTGDPKIAAMIEHEAIKQDIDPAWALAVGVLESGLQEGNTMGVIACYGKNAKRLGTHECIRIGVVSLHNRLWDATVTAPTKTQLWECGKGSWGDTIGCRALIRYNGSASKKYGYARHGVAMARKIRKWIELNKPET